MIDVVVNGQKLKGDDMLAIVPSDNEVHLVFNRYGKDDCISFNEKEDKINVRVEIEGRIPENTHWSGEKF